ncbi:unnamed protein product [Owenia fusiformis]|uniref:NEDD8 ultimate buster 1 n=1 Tax=Owenia fusiformis TaxID=6347 RepID=A0A8S4P3A2_OWEFU|nr:unnamed protein product [Owenia fusiformis]
MAESFNEHMESLIRDKLNHEKIKLWLPPYTTELGEKGEIPKEMVERFSTDLGLCEDVILTVCEHLRCHALEKLAARKKFQQSGIASLKIKLSGKLPDEMTKCQKLLSLEVGLQQHGQVLKNEISKHSGLDPHRLKIISGGRVIEDDQSLLEQNVKHGSQVMAICLSETETEARLQQQQMDKFNQTKQAAELLAGTTQSSDGDDYYLQIADQSGKSLNLPKEERQALTLAMTLHEKGRAALKKKEYAEALLLLLEADKQFSKCRADILNAVDNYAIVCLDIVWCYLCLKNIRELPNAESRLRSCEECFHRSYGQNLERLTMVKGGTGVELALFVRLHLLQAILAFHQNRMNDSRNLLEKAELELGKLHIDSDKMTELMTMGFTQHEARLGLRACQNNVTRAVAHITQKKQEKREIREKEKEERKQNKLAKRFGKTAAGQMIDMTKYDQLVSMGFPKGACSEALKQSNNNLDLALQVLEEHPEYLSLPDPPVEKIAIPDEMIAQVVSMGFDPQVARTALERFGLNVTSALDELIKYGGVLPENLHSPSTRRPHSGSSSQKTAEQIQREKEAMERISDDIPDEEDDYLDLTLEEEKEFLAEYKALVESSTTLSSTYKDGVDLQGTFKKLGWGGSAGNL